MLLTLYNLPNKLISYYNKFTNAEVIAARRRSYRSDSCPAVPDYKDYVELVSRKANMKNRRTSCCAPFSTNQRHVFANQLAVSILDEATI